MEKELVSKVSASEIKQYIRSARNTAMSGTSLVILPSGFIVFDFSKINADFCTIEIRRDSGNGLLTTHSCGRNQECQISSKTGQKLDFKIGGDKLVHFHRTNRGSGNIAIMELSLYNASQRRDWGAELKKSKEYACLRLIDNVLFASDGGFIKGNGISLETDPPGMFSRNAEGIKFCGSCKIVSLTIDGQEPVVETPPTAPEPVPEPVLENVLFDTKTAGFSGVYCKGGFVNPGGITLDNNGSYSVPLSVIQPGYQYVITVYASRVDGNGKMRIGLLPESVGGSVENVVDSTLVKPFSLPVVPQLGNQGYLVSVWRPPASRGRVQIHRIMVQGKTKINWDQVNPAMPKLRHIDLKASPIVPLIPKTKKDIIIYDSKTGFIPRDMSSGAKLVAKGLFLENGGRYLVRGLEAGNSYTLMIDVGYGEGDKIVAMLTNNPNAPFISPIVTAERITHDFKAITADSIAIFKPGKGSVILSRVILVKHLEENSPLSVLPSGTQKPTWLPVLPCFVDTEKEDVDASILVTSFKRPGLLRHGLASLAKQNFRNYKVEVIVLNDWLPDETENVCKEFKNLNVKYVFTGQRNFYEELLRTPGYAINIGAKIARGKYIFISCAEIYHMSNTVADMLDVLKNGDTALETCQGKEDPGVIVQMLNSGNIITDANLNAIPKLVGMELPYFLGMSKRMFFEIGGYDEDFIGLVADDNDLSERLVKNGGEYKYINNTIVHLHHGRLLDDRCRLNVKDADNQSRVNLNRELYAERASYVARNPNGWGGINVIQRSNEWHLSNIPKIAHFYWGASKLPFLRYLTLYSFVKQNPDWKVKLHKPSVLGTIVPTWKSQEQKESTHTHQVSTDYSTEVKKLGVEEVFHDFDGLGFSNTAHEVHKSDFLRWILLATEGGIWCDMDILFTRPMVHMIDNVPGNSAVNSCVCTYNDGTHAIGFLMSSENNPFYNDVAARSKKAFNKNNYQSIGSVMMCRYYGSVQKIKSVSPQIVPLYINLGTVYPITSVGGFLRTDNDIEQYPNAIGFHWYGGHPDTSKIEATIDNTNYMSNKTLIGKLVTHILGAK